MLTFENNCGQNMLLFGPPNIEKLKAGRNVNGLIKALGYRKDWRIRRDAAHALGELGDVRAVEPLIAALRDDVWFVRAAAAEALGQIGDTRAVEPLITALQDREWKVRQFAAEALTRIGDLRAWQPLVDCLRDDRHLVRAAALQALVCIDAQKSVPLLIAALQDEEIEVGRLAAKSLVRLYHEGQLSDETRQAILKWRPVIVKHHDVMGQNRWGCRLHQDEGLNVEFPL